MKLIDLQPKWVSTNSFRKGMGMSFDCPHCSMRVVIMFDNPLDGGFPDDPNVSKWERIGDSFETISIGSKIDIPLHWTGYISNGELVEHIPAI